MEPQEGPNVDDRPSRAGYMRFNVSQVMQDFFPGPKPSKFRLWGLRVQGFRILGLGFRVRGFKFGFQGLGFRI